MTSPLVTALAAMTVACPDPTHFAEFLVDVWDWEILVKSPLSADVERLWSLAGRILSKGRCRRTAANAEKVLLLNRNFELVHGRWAH